MSPGSFCQLHNHTEYSLLDGAARIPDLADRAVELQMPALAITDHGAMYGVIEFYQNCLDRGIKPIIGCELYLAPGSRHEHTGGQQELAHLVLLAKDRTGYGNLLKVVTDAHLHGFYYKPRADFELLAEHSAGLIATTACLQGGICRRLLNEDETSARQYLGQLQEIYGPDNVYLELQDHGIPQQQEVNEAILRIARDTDTPLLATNDVHYVNKEDARLHDVLLCIQTDATLQQEERMRFPTEEFYLKSQEQMEALFGDCPGALTNTVEVAERCNLELELGNLSMPKLDVPDGYTSESHLRKLCEDNLESRYGSRRPDVVERLDYELDVIEQTGYTGYFLIVGDFVSEARRRDILVGPGRGSATGSVVAYLLGITDVDPIKYNLIFERMLNPERVSPPDIDLDFPDDRREDIINYVKTKYGEDQVAQVITFSRMGPKASIRDVGRALEVPLDQINELCKLVPSGPKATIQDALDDSAELSHLVKTDPQVKEIIEYAQGLEGLVRHVSVHAAAVVIADRPITDLTPLCGGNKGAVTTQYSMDDVEACGLVKMDFLGLKTLTVINNALDAVAANHGKRLSVHDIPLDDPKTYELLCRANTAAVFQLESEGMQSLIKQLQPDRFEHVIALVALYRPGPMQHANEFCEGRHGAEIHYLHPLLEPILEETYGVILYQEQVMKIAVELAGLSMPQAEIIMQAMSKKQEDKMAQMQPLFMSGCVANGVSEDVAQAIYNRMETFSGYGFNKSHSAAYGLVAYWTAYLKANYPAELLAAHLSTVMDNTDDISKYVMECRRMGIEVRPPSVNFSEPEFAVMEGAVVFGLAAIKNFGRASAQAIVDERAAGGPYEGLSDFCRRLPGHQVTKANLKLLVQAGALDEFGDRSALLAVHEAAFAAGQKYQEDQSVGQNSLFDALEGSEAEAATEQLPSVSPMSDDDKLAMEREFLGLYISDHPLIRATEKLATCCTCFIEELSSFPDNEVVVVGGMVGETKNHTASNGAAMMFMTLEGLEQSVEVTLFPNVYEKHKDTAVKGDIVIVEGQVQRRSRIVGDGDEVVDIKLLAKKLRPLRGARALSEARRQRAEAAKQRQKERSTARAEARQDTEVHIELDLSLATPAALQRLRDVIRNYPGSQPVVLEFKQNGLSRRVNLGKEYTVTHNQKLTTQTRQIEAVTAIWV